MALLFWGGEGADLKPTPDAIAPAGDKAVDRIGEKGRNKAKEPGHDGPGSWEFAQGGKDGVGFGQIKPLGGKGVTNGTSAPGPNAASGRSASPSRTTRSRATARAPIATESGKNPPALKLKNTTSSAAPTTMQAQVYGLLHPQIEDC